MRYNNFTLGIGSGKVFDKVFGRVANNRNPFNYNLTTKQQDSEITFVILSFKR